MSVQDKANELGLSGYVKNLFTNALEIVAEGKGMTWQFFQHGYMKGHQMQLLKRLVLNGKNFLRDSFLSLDSEMKIALCQVNTIVGNFEYNKEKILKYYNKCINNNASIIAFPELVYVDIHLKTFC